MILYEFLLEVEELIVERDKILDLRTKALAVIDSLLREAELLDIEELKERAIWQGEELQDHVAGYDILLSEINMQLLEMVA